MTEPAPAANAAPPAPGRWLGRVILLACITLAGSALIFRHELLLAYRLWEIRNAHTAQPDELNAQLMRIAAYGARAARPLADLAESDRPAVRHAALRILQRWANPAAASQIRQLARERHRSHAGRVALLRVATRVLPPDEATGLATELLAGGGPITAEAADALAYLQGPDFTAARALAELRGQPDPERLAALVAATILAGASFTPDQQEAILQAAADRYVTILLPHEAALLFAMNPGLSIEPPSPRARPLRELLDDLFHIGRPPPQTQPSPATQPDSAAEPPSPAG